MAKMNNESVSTNGKPIFYACVYEDLRKAALNCGWALGLHGSLANDMDIMAMPWTEEATSVEKLIESMCDCFSDSPFHKTNHIPYYNKPNGRVVYTISIYADFYLDINVIQNKI